MKRITCTSVSAFVLLSAAFFLRGDPACCQTIFWTETFNNGCSYYCTSYTGANGPWVFTQPGSNGSTHNIWFVSCAENGNSPGACGTGCGSNASLHVGNDPNSLAGWLFCPTGDCGAAYDASSASEVSNIRAASPRINCTGKGTITANFVYIGRGQASYDYCVFEYSANDGSTWTALTGGLTTVNTGCLGQGKWTNVATVALPASANNNPMVRVAFHWVNNGDGAGSDPSFAVNDLRMSYTVTLPVEWLSFEATRVNKKLALRWSTASEINNDYFEIERSADAEIFSAIGKMEGAGNTTVVQHYSFDDAMPMSGLNYYRIRQVDLDGTPHYSSVVAVKYMQGDPAFNVSRSQSGMFTVAFQSETESNVQFILYNVLGEELKSWNVNAKEGFNNVQLDIENVKPCICPLRMVVDEESYVKKVAFN